jgi:hypothetical protein
MIEKFIVPTILLIIFLIAVIVLLIIKGKESLQKLADLLDYCNEYADFRNGVTYQGIDEGQVYTDKYFMEIKKYLKTQRSFPFPVTEMKEDDNDWEF